MAQPLPQRRNSGARAGVRDAQAGNQPQVVEMNEHQEDVGNRISRELDQDAADHRPDHLPHVLGDHVQGHGIDQPVSADNVEYARAAGRVLDGLGGALDEGREKDVPGLQRIQPVEHQREQASCGGQVGGLGQQHHPLPREQVGDIAGKGGDEGPGQVVEHPEQHQLRGVVVGDVQDEEAQRQYFIPAPELGQYAHGPDNAKVALSHQSCSSSADPRKRPHQCSTDVFPVGFARVPGGNPSILTPVRSSSGCHQSRRIFKFRTA